jgi:hypothetical protein
MTGYNAHQVDLANTLGVRIAVKKAAESCG